MEQFLKDADDQKARMSPQGRIVKNLRPTIKDIKRRREWGGEEEEVFGKILKSKSNLRRLSPLPK